MKEYQVTGSTVTYEERDTGILDGIETAYEDPITNVTQVNGANKNGEVQLNLHVSQQTETSQHPTYNG